MKGGAVDFLTKPVNDQDLLAAVRNAIEIDRLAREAQVEVDALRQRLASLTPREREVLVHVVAGRLNKQIAADLGIVEKTIKVHRARIMEKMAVRSLADLVRIAERLGIHLPRGVCRHDSRRECEELRTGPRRERHPAFSRVGPRSNSSRRADLVSPP